MDKGDTKGDAMIIFGYGKARGALIIRWIVGLTVIAAILYFAMPFVD